jgi:hypothetical protein
MELKYLSKDVCKLVDIFYELSRGIKDNNKLAVEIKKLTQYPTNVINEFLTCVSILNEKQVKENYIGVIGYIAMRLNLVENS